MKKKEHKIRQEERRKVTMNRCSIYWMIFLQDIIDQNEDEREVI
jgi:hypothetical protein